VPLKRIGLFAFMVLAIALGGFISTSLWLPVQPQAPVVVVIAPGTSTHGIARQLKGAGVIRSVVMFRMLARFSGDAHELQSGEYRFADPATLEQVMQRLRRGDVVLHLVTIAEGLRSDEILAVLAEHTGTPLQQWQAAYARLLAEHGDKEPGEGLLLPETYTYRRPVDAYALLKDMMQAQDALLSSLQPAWQDAGGLRIVASIIEKETALDAERPIIAAVVRNRLHKNMALQMDPTVIYGLWREDGSFSGNLHKQDMERDTPWNSYMRKGLPPTPICNPGSASLRAAAHPANVDYLYFVANGSGGHAFAATLEEHNRNVQRWIKVERGGERQ
jgi:peptidoglycan lytic transglycosylase G